ncbi:MAG: GNAT family N-acetyltransferase [Spirochaetales bacterium]|nr:GNAT family N-acetyltransferase [Spirochaetales bacterium]
MEYAKANNNDLDGIEKILKLSFSPVYAGYAKKSFKLITNALVAKNESGLIAGVINWKIFTMKNRKLGYIFWLAVHPDNRKQGIGKTLAKMAIEILVAEHGVEEVYVGMEKENTQSRSLFQKAGFACISRSEMKKKFRAGRLKLYTGMMLMPWEDLLVLPVTGSGA